MPCRIIFLIALILVIFSEHTQASITSIGYQGANASNLRRSDLAKLKGNGVVVGQLDLTRSSSPNVDSPALSNTFVVPDKLFAVDTEIDTPAEIVAAKDMNIIDSDGGQHALATAGLIKSTNPLAPGIATVSTFYSGYYFIPTDVGEAPAARAALALQEMATHGTPAEHARVINMSFAIGGPTDAADGTDQYSQFLDWSANEHDVLYVIAGPQGATALPLERWTSTYNGIVVGESVRAGASSQGYFRSSELQRPRINDNEIPGGRTRVDILAPGVKVGTNLPGAANGSADFTGTSFATPHVTGVAALLLEYANYEVTNGAMGFDQDSQRHEVIKSVILNSANKLRDTGNGHRLWQTSTIQDIKDPSTGVGGNTWLQSEAYLMPDTPLDDEMGAGHLNGGRALKQLAQGEFDAVPNGVAIVPSVGWDYHRAPNLDINTFDPEYVKYKIETVLPQGSWISTTLAWDRQPPLLDDINSNGRYDATFVNVGGSTEIDTEDTFFEFAFTDDFYDDLNLYIVPEGATDISQAIPKGVSNCSECTTEHLFVDVPLEGKYEIWVERTQDFFVTDYALSWWSYEIPLMMLPGDANGDGINDVNDFQIWASNFGSSVTPGSLGDFNSDGTVNAADYTIWRDNFGAVASTTAVPEPGTMLLVVLTAITCGLSARGNWLAA